MQWEYHEIESEMMEQCKACSLRWGQVTCCMLLKTHREAKQVYFSALFTHFKIFLEFLTEQTLFGYLVKIFNCKKAEWM